MATDWEQYAVGEQNNWDQYAVGSEPAKKEYSLNIFGDPEKFKNAIEWFTKSPSVVGLKKSVESVPLAMQQAVANTFDLPNYRKQVESRIAENNKEYNQAFNESPILTSLGSITGDLPYAIPAFETGGAAVSQATRPIMARLSSLLQGQSPRIQGIANESMQILQRILQGGAGAATHSAVQPVAEGETRSSNVQEGAESGALVSALLESLGLGGRALSAGFNQLRPSNMFRGNLAPQELEANLRAAQGTNTPLGDIIQSPTLKKTFENASVPTPLSGGQDILNTVNNQVEGRANHVVNNLAPNGLVGGDPNQVAQGLLRQAYETQNTLKNDLYNDVSRLAQQEGFNVTLPTFERTARQNAHAIESSPLLQTNDKIRTAYNKLSQINQARSPTQSAIVGANGQPLMNPAEAPSIRDAKFIANTMGAEADRLLSSPLRAEQSLGNLYRRLSNDIREDIRVGIQQRGTPELQNAYATADTNYAENFSPFLDENAYKFLAPGYDAQSFVREVINPSKQHDKYTNIERIQNLLPPGNENLMGFAYLRGAVDKEGNLNPKELKVLINKLGNRQFEALFPDAATRETLNDYVRLANMNPEALNVMFNARNGSRTAQTLIASLGTFASGGALYSGHPVAAASAIIAPIIGARLFNRWVTSPTVRENMVRAMQRPQNAIGRSQQNEAMRQLQQSLIAAYKKSQPKESKE